MSLGEHPPVSAVVDREHANPSGARRQRRAGARSTVAQPIVPAGSSAGEVDVVLRDGSTLHVRPVCAGDEPAVLAFLHGLSDASRRLRYFSLALDFSAAAHRIVDADPGERAYGLVALTGHEGEVVAHAGYVRERPGSAEVAFAIADAWQGRGLATVLLAHLAAHAHANGVCTFTAVVLPENHRMIEVFRESGFPVEVRAGIDEVEVTFPTQLSDHARDRFERREQIASVAAVRGVLEPSNVALIGASRRRGTVGGEILHNLVTGGFEGAVYPVNPSARSVQAMPAYRSLSEIPAAIDTAIIAVPAASVLDAVRDCGAHGVRSLVVISAGFRETGKQGARMERELLAVCREHGMRLVGPNCLGVLNTADHVGLNATFIPRQPTPGHVGFLSQSGGLGIAIVDAANRLGMGLSAFVSVGNKADLSSNDFLSYWEQDDQTDVILLYLESFGNARKFARVARRVARHKPIVAVKSGRSVAGARATSSHTGAMLAASDLTVDALFRQAGVIRTDTLSELFDVASLLTSQPPPRGNRVAIVTNVGGPAILCADACEASGLEVVALDAKLRARLRRLLPSGASVGNPVDMIATASAEHYRRAIETIARADVADAIVVIFAPPLVTEAVDVANAVSQAAAKLPADIPLIGVFMAERLTELPLRRGARRLACFAFPEDAARVLGHAARYGAWLRAPAGQIPSFTDCRPDEAAAIVAAGLGRGGGGWLSPREVNALLDCYGLSFPASAQVRTAAEAGRAALEMGGSVALKAIAPGLVHKSDAGAVRVGLSGGQVAGAARAMTSKLSGMGYAVEGFLVQQMVPPGVELIVGVVQDATFGPVVACGAGGTSAELAGDVAARLTPLTDLDAHEALRGLRLFPLLDGYRGAPRCDVAALEQLLLRVSALVDDHPEIAEMDLNPVVALAQGALIVDARIRLAQAAQPPLPSVARAAAA